MAVAEDLAGGMVHANHTGRPYVARRDDTWWVFRPFREPMSVRTWREAMIVAHNW